MRPTLLPWGLTAASAAVGGWRYAELALNHDAGSFLLMARGLAEGRVLYESFPDYSMPANAWLATLCLRVSNATGITLAYVNQALFLALTAAGAVLAGSVVRRACGPGSIAGWVMPPLLMGLFLIIPGYDFGERDILFAVLAAPLVALVAARHVGVAPGWAMSLAVAALAAVGSSLKPQVGLPLLVLGVSDLALRRFRLRAVARELWLLAGLLAVYAASVQLLYPTYFSEVLGDAARIYAYMAVWGFSVVWSMRVAAASGAVALALLLALLVPRLRSRRPMPWGLGAGWAAFGTALALMDLLQRQGQRYHSVPALLFALASAGLFAALAAEDARAAWRRGARATPLLRVGAVALALFATLVLAERSYRPQGVSRQAVLADPLTRTMRSLPPGSVVLAFETGVLPISPLHAYADVRWAAPFSQNHEVAAIMLDRKRAAAEARARDPFFVALERRVRAAALVALTERPPELVFVDVSPALRWFEHYGAPFALLAWFAEDPAFAAAWSGYDHVETVTAFVGVPTQIWRRRAGRALVGQTAVTPG